MSIKLNIIKNARASLFEKGSKTLLRLIQIPLLIYFLGVEDFGRWTVLYTIPSWLTLANFGFGTVASNQITMFVAEKSIGKAKIIYASTFFLLLIIFIVGMILTIAIVPIVNWNSLLKVENINYRATEFTLAVIFMSITVFLSFFYGLFSSAFRAKRKMHLNILITTILPWINLIAMIVALKFTNRFDYLSQISYLLLFILFTVIG
jgi:O-antigen/teichoic acid export membrane protein